MSEEKQLDPNINAHRMTTQQAAEYLGLKPDTLVQRRRKGQKPIYYKLGSKVFYKKKDLDAFFDEGKVEPTNG